jgi:hypothetical protein
LEQCFAEVCIAGQKRSTASKGLSEGATKHGYSLVREGMAKTTSTISQNAQGMGFIHQESGSVAGAELCHGAQVGTGALHAE